MNTATLREPQPIHEVDFHGATLNISIDMDVFWLAADADGAVCVYEYAPIRDEGAQEFMPNDNADFFIGVAKVDLDGINWRDTAKRYQVES